MILFLCSLAPGGVLFMFEMLEQKFLEIFKIVSLFFGARVEVLIVDLN